MRLVMSVSACLLLLAGMWLALGWGRVDPAVRNIVYFHVPSAIAALLCFVVLSGSGTMYLIKQKAYWDHLSAASAAVGLLFATVLNVTGSIFSRAEWDVWWTPSPRLMSSAFLWFLLVVYLILRSSIDAPRRRARFCAVFGIIAFLDVPMVYISARFLPDIHRPNFSFGEPAQRIAFLLSLLGTFLLGAVLLWLQYDIISTRAKLNEYLYSKEN